MRRLELRAHDLLWIRHPNAIRWRGLECEPQAWLRQWLASGAPTPVVVRRESPEDAGLVPVGVRGVERCQRQAAYLPREAVLRVTRPEDLIGRVVPNAVPGGAQHRLLRALAAIKPAMDAMGLAWGPTGSLGFSLATGHPTVHKGSDLDLVLRAPQPLSTAQTQALASVIKTSRCRIDLQVDTSVGGFAFTEWLQHIEGQAEHLSTGGRILLKTDVGPLLVDDPWDVNHQIGRHACSDTALSGAA